MSEVIERNETPQNVVLFDTMIVSTCCDNIGHGIDIKIPALDKRISLFQRMVTATLKKHASHDSLASARFIADELDTITSAILRQR